LFCVCLLCTEVFLGRMAASIVTGLTASEEGDSVCPVCIDIYDDPVDLQCPTGRHSFCLDCLASLIVVKDGKNTVKCPMCYEVSILTGDKSTRFGLSRNDLLRGSADEKRAKVKETRPLEGEGLGSFEEMMKAIQSVSQVVAPRNIKLLEEFDLAIGKDGKTNIPDDHMGMVMYGIDKEKFPEETEEYVKLSHWRAILIGPQESPIGAVIYNVLAKVPDGYPLEPPEVRFEGPKVKMPAVNDSGLVTLSKLEGADLSKLDGEGMVEKGNGVFFKWDPHSHNIIDCLVAIRENMHIKEINKASANVAGSNYS